MDAPLLTFVAAFFDALVHYPRVGIFIVIGLSAVVPLLVLTCIFVRDHHWSLGGKLH